MPIDPFVHLHVASGYSLRHGASSPAALVARAAQLGQESLALTDRDGMYGVVGFVLAAQAAGVRPLVGVDLGCAPTPGLAPPGAVGAAAPPWQAGSTGAPGARVRRTAAGRLGSGPALADRMASGREPGRAGTPPGSPPRTPVRGGTAVDPMLPRVVLLARDARGYAALCRLVSAAHLHGERGEPVATAAQIAAHAGQAPGALVALLGPDSEVGRALAVRRPDLAVAALAPWRELFGAHVHLEVVSHRTRDSAQAAADLDGSRRGRAWSSAFAARMLGFAREQGVGAVLANAVRHADQASAPVIDVLDAIRRLVPLDARHLDRANAEGYLKSGEQMAMVAEEVCRLAGAADSRGAAAGLLAATRELAESCVLDPVADVGIGEVHVPELEVVLDPAAAHRVPAGYDARRRHPDAVAAEAAAADTVLRSRAEAGLVSRGLHRGARGRAARERLETELATIAALGFAGYFLTVAEVVDLIRDMDVRVAARGSGAGSLVNHALGISGVDPLAHGLVMERFLSPLRRALPDIDVDVESARRPEVYARILARFGGDRCTCVSMRDTYRVRHAVRDVGAAFGLPAGEVDAFAKAFPHIRARDARAALRELPELRSSGFGRLAADGRLDGFLSVVEAMDGLPRHIALHPCGVLLSDATMLDRTPVEASFAGFPMSQFDKDDVEELGFLKLDVLGIRMQSAMAHALEQIALVDDVRVELDAVPLDDGPAFELIRSAHTLGCFQIESPGQRELIGKFGPETFNDLVIDISLFRPGPVKSDMVNPFLRARQGWSQPQYLHPDLRPALAETYGVVVFHEQVLRVVSVMTGCSLAEADEVRRSLGATDTQPQVREWFYPAALARGYALEIVERVWDVLHAFASFGFCKAHAAAFALPTYQSAWLKAHHPAAFLSGVLTHDPGMYPKRLILDDARQLGIAVLGLDVNRSQPHYAVEKVDPYDEPPPEILGLPPRQAPTVPGVPDARAYGIRLALAEVKGISDAEVQGIVAGRPYASLADFWHRTRVARPVVERLVMAGAFDSLYGIGARAPVRRRGRVTRRDLLLQVADLDRWSRATAGGRAGAARGGSRGGSRGGRVDPFDAAFDAAGLDGPSRSVALAAAQRGTTAAALPAAEQQVQLALDLGDAPGEVVASGLAELTDPERVRAELEVLGLDVSRHVVDFYTPMLTALGVTRSRDLLAARSRSLVLVAGVKVATQTPPVRSGRRVVFLTLDDATGPVDATFFDDAQGPYATTLFHSWLLLVRGEVRRTGPRGVSVRGIGAWELGEIHQRWQAEGVAGVLAMIDAAPEGSTPAGVPPAGDQVVPEGRRVLVHPSGFRQSPYADIKPAGPDTAAAPPSKLWHSSPGSSGW